MLEKIISKIKSRIIVAAIGTASIIGCSGTMVDPPEYAKKQISCCEILDCNNQGYDGCKEWSQKIDQGTQISCDCYRNILVTRENSSSEKGYSSYTIKEYARMCPPDERGLENVRCGKSDTQRGQHEHRRNRESRYDRKDNWERRGRDLPNRPVKPGCHGEGGYHDHDRDSRR